MNLVGELISERGVDEQRFDVKCDNRLVPGIVWTPTGATGSRPLVVIGHGGGGTKRMPYVLSLARRLVRHHGFAAACIDGPQHGDREGPKSDGPAWWTPDTTDEMIADTKATRAELQQLDGIGEGPLGYWGFSMGTIFGLPYVASEPDVQVAVLGLMGITGPTRDRIEDDAKKITCPTMFVFQWDDELFPREAGLALFDALAATDKRMHVNPGAHSAVPVEEFEATEAFLAKHLAP
jgi:dienelactone hydrolase